VSNKTAPFAGPRSITLLPCWARPLLVALAGSLLGACAQAHPDDHAAESGGAVEWPVSFAGIPQLGNALGSPSAPVTLVELSDLRCSHCRDFDEHTLPVLVDRYVRSGRLRIVFENYPILGSGSVQAARLAVAAGLQGHEFELIDAFFHLPPGPVSDDTLRRAASQVPGLDVEAAMAALDSPVVDGALAEARGVARRFSIDGTPSFLLGRTGAEPHTLPDARATRPETLAGPIDEMLAQP